MIELMGRVLTKRQIKHIVHLRERGHSLPEIKRATRHSSSTVFKYIQNVKILPEFIDFWKSKRKSSIFRMIQEQRRAQEQAKSLFGKIGEEEKLIIVACLYWAEGEKKDFSLSNTDPNLIRVFIECLKSLGVTKKDLRINIRVYEDLDIPAAISFWAKVVGIPKSQIVSVNVLKGKKKGKLQYGMCRVRIIKGGYLLKLIKSLVDLITSKTISPCSSTDRTGGS